MNTFCKIIIAVCLFACHTHASAQVKEWFGATPDLHVSGKNLVDPEGNVVTLHGVMDTPNAYFNGWRWTGGQTWADYNSEQSVEAVKKYFTKIFEAIANPSQGTYCNLFRLHLDPAWLQDNSITATGFTNVDGKTATDPHGMTVADEANICHFSEAKLRERMQDLYIPIIKDALAHGLYVVVRPPGVFPHEVKVGDYYFDYLNTVWNIVSSDSYIQSNSGKIMLELGNEPVHIHEASETIVTHPNEGYTYDKNNTSVLRDYFQPIVTTIRNNGFTGIILLPGTSYQAEYRSYVNNPITDSANNYGYAVHNYPGWYGGWNPSQTEAQFISTFETQVPVDSKPIVITEVDWSPMKEGAGHWNEMHTQYTEGNFGTWGTGTTNSPAPNVTYKNTQNVGWGSRYKALIDKYPNISWTLQGTTTYVDMDKYLADGTIQPAFTDQMKAAGYTDAGEACSKACFDWFYGYACGNRLPRFSTTATSTGDVKFENETNKYIFYTSSYASFDFPDFKGTKLEECADFTIKLKENTIGYRLDFQLKDAQDNYIQTVNPGDQTKINYVLGTDENGMRIADVDKAKENTFNIQELFKEYIKKYPGCTIENIRINTVVSSEDTERAGLYYLKLDKMDMTVSQVTARKTQYPSLADIPMYEHAIDGNQKLLKALTTTVKNVVLSNDAEGTAFGGWGADDIAVKSNEGMNSSKGYVLKNYSEKANDYTAQFAIPYSDGFANGREYTLKLDVKGTVAGSVGVAIQKTQGYVGCGNFPNLPITTEWQTVTLKATVSGDGADRILLNFGKYVGTMYLDNIEVYTETLKASGYEDKIGSGESVSTLYGFVSPNYANYVDISDYKSIKFTGSATDGKIRLFLNCSKKPDGTTKEDPKTIDVNSTYDISTLPYAHLHSIKASAYDKTATLSSVVLVKKSDDSEVQLSSLPFSQWDVKAEGEEVSEITSFNKNFGQTVTNDEVYGVNGNVYYTEYVDLSDYAKMVIKGTGGTLRVLFNRITDGGAVTEVNPSLSSGEAVIDLRNIDNKGFVHLHSIKTYETVNVESITLINEDDPYTFADYYISGAGSHAASADDALADVNATVIDLSGFTGKWDDTFRSANPNCILIYKDENNIGNRFNGRNLAKRSGSTYDTSSISLVENFDFRAPVDITTVAEFGATYTRDLASNNWGTIALPFALDVTAADSPLIFQLTSSDSDNLVFKQVTSETLPAGSVILYYKENGGTTVLKGSNIAKTAEGFNIQSVADMDGWYTAQNFKQLVIDDVATDPVLKDYDVYAIQKNNFVHATKKLTLKPFRAIFLHKKGSGAAKANYGISIYKDDATGVNTADSEIPTEHSRYDLTGRRIQTATKGVNIVRYSNGNVKRILVK